MAIVNGGSATSNFTDADSSSASIAGNPSATGGAGSPSGRRGACVAIWRVSSSSRQQRGLF